MFVISSPVQWLRPELYASITEKLVFQRLDYDTQLEIARLMLDRHLAHLATMGHYLTAPQLHTVSGTLYACAISVFEAPHLTAIGGHLIATGRTMVVSAPKLERIGGNFLTKWTEIIIAPQLRNVGGSIETTHADRFYCGGIKVGGVWKPHPLAVRRWRVNETAREALRDPGIEL